MVGHGARLTSLVRVGGLALSILSCGSEPTGTRIPVCDDPGIIAVTTDVTTGSPAFGVSHRPIFTWTPRCVVMEMMVSQFFPDGTLDRFWEVSTFPYNEIPPGVQYGIAPKGAEMTAPRDLVPGDSYEITLVFGATPYPRVLTRQFTVPSAAAGFVERR